MSAKFVEKKTENENIYINIETSDIYSSFFHFS